ncbi:Z-DNA-binding protein 1 [Myotis lucifugus]|uniref:Z-DNA-binding protein 1 n=1 Tax=Myotis lucifugus TaxID=59463 RepID=UPI000CCC3929|nr:Z-DNA-binding protein 1 [Myotis lucifugus]
MLISPGFLGLFPGCKQLVPAREASLPSQLPEAQPQPHRDTSLDQPTFARPPSLPGLLSAAVSMAQASADIDETDLEQRILQALKGAGTPVKAAQLEKECQVPRKDINRVLYRMKEKLKVDRDDSAKWSLREGGPGEMVPAEPAQPSHELQGQILRLLEASGPQRAVSIARSLGMKTSKDVNPYLYAMQEKHLLDLDKNSKTWAIYQPGTPRAPTIIYQQSPVMICQNAPHSHISIQNSEAVQIGHGNTIMKLMAPSESGESPGRCPGRTWGSCSVWVGQGTGGSQPSKEKGRPSDHHGPPSRPPESEGVFLMPGSNLPDSLSFQYRSPHSQGTDLFPTVSAATAGPEEIRMPAPGPHPEGEGDAAQSVPIKPCFVEEDAIGNSNSLSVCRAGAGAGPEASRGDPGEPAEHAAPGSRAAEPRGKFPDGAGPADPDMSTFTSHLEAMTLEDRDSEAPEDSP